MLNATHVPALSCRGHQTRKAARTERPPVLMTAGTPAAHFLVQPRAREDARRRGADVAGFNNVFDRRRAKVKAEQVEHDLTLLDYALQCEKADDAKDEAKVADREGRDAETLKYPSMMFIKPAKTKRQEKQLAFIRMENGLAVNSDNVSTVMDKIAEHFDPFYQFWTYAQGWRDGLARWRDGAFIALDAEGMDRDVTAAFKVMFKMGKAFNQRQLPDCAKNCDAGTLSGSCSQAECIGCTFCPGISETYLGKMQTDEVLLKAVNSIRKIGCGDRI